MVPLEKFLKKVKLINTLFGTWDSAKIYLKPFVESKGENETLSMDFFLLLSK